jgi:hypothetical protein
MVVVLLEGQLAVARQLPVLVATASVLVLGVLAAPAHFHLPFLITFF